MYYYTEHQQAYEALARDGKTDWNELFDEHPFPHRPSLERALDLLGLPPGARILEYGCGTGTAARFLAAKGYRVHAVDLIPTAIEIARRMTAEQGLEVDFEVRDICGTSFDARYSAVFDGFCPQSIVTDEDRARLFSAVRSALAPGGHYLIATAMYDPDRIYERDETYDDETGVVRKGGMPHRRHLRPEALEAELAAQGFRILSHEGDHGGKLVCARSDDRTSVGR